MIHWFAEFSGRAKPLGELNSPELVAMTEPLQAFLAERLSSFADSDEHGDIEVTFSWTPTGLLGFSMKGDPVDIADAKVLIGERAEFQHLQS